MSPRPTTHEDRLRQVALGGSLPVRSRTGSGSAIYLRPAAEGSLQIHSSDNLSLAATRSVDSIGTSSMHRLKAVSMGELNPEGRRTLEQLFQQSSSTAKLSTVGSIGRSAGTSISTPCVAAAGSQATVTTGKQIGDYVLGETLGKGRYSVVKLARHSITGENVAIKVVAKARLSKEDTRVLQREMQIMKLLDHPNIVRLYEVIDTPDHFYLVLEYVNGTTLTDELPKFAKMKRKKREDLMRGIMGQLASALAYCHASHVVHRDIKPDNVMLDGSGRVKLADWGFSNMATELLNTHCGTPYYASPELFRPQPYRGPPSDVWAMGVLLYLCVTNKLPFRNEPIREQISRGEYSTPSSLSSDLQQLIRRMLTVSPSRRITAEEILVHPYITVGERVPQGWYPTRSDSVTAKLAHITSPLVLEGGSTGGRSSWEGVIKRVPIVRRHTFGSVQDLKRRDRTMEKVREEGEDESGPKTRDGNVTKPGSRSSTELQTKTRENGRRASWVVRDGGSAIVDDDGNEGKDEKDGKETKEGDSNEGEGGSKTEVRQDIVTLMVYLGFTVEEVCQSLQSNSYDQVTATYFLLRDSPSLQQYKAQLTSVCASNGHATPPFSPPATHEPTTPTPPASAKTLTTSVHHLWTEPTSLRQILLGRRRSSSSSRTPPSLNSPAQVVSPPLLHAQTPTQQASRQPSVDSGGERSTDGKSDTGSAMAKFLRPRAGSGPVQGGTSRVINFLFNSIGFQSKTRTRCETVGAGDVGHSKAAGVVVGPGMPPPNHLSPLGRNDQQNHMVQLEATAAGSN